MVKKNQNQKRETPKRITKKDQILSLHLNGITEINDLARMTGTRPSYVASVLQQAGLISGYFDLYTSTSSRMNVYSHLFAHKLKFKDAEAAHQSINFIDQLYKQFEKIGDRAGQHHALMMALVMFNRARWTNKMDEADIFRHWLIDSLENTQFNEEAKD